MRSARNFPFRKEASDLDVELPDGAEVFMCGPLPFMQATRKALLGKGISGERVHYEVFGPDLWAQNADNAEEAE